jgi:catechol 2,3-dioxygenase-like lactoylglutathione lyase family enzyme
VNVQVPDQGLATRFYISGLGLTRDPYLMTGTENMWVNVGRQQFHLFVGAPQVLRGVTGLVMADLAALRERLRTVQGGLAGTRFAVRDGPDYVEAVCPWGNRIRCHAPDRRRFGALALGLAYVTLDVPVGTLDAIARFYGEVMGFPSRLEVDAEGALLAVCVGPRQHLRFRENPGPQAPFDGHHLQIYVADFGGLWSRLDARKLITAESNAWQYFFRDIVDPRDGRIVFQIDHEIRSATHPLYGRDLVNRNPAQTARDYRAGHDALAYTLPPI